MGRVFVVFFLNGGAANICTAAFFALAEIFFAFVAAGVAAVVLGAHVLLRSCGETYGRVWEQ